MEEVDLFEGLVGCQPANYVAGSVPLPRQRRQAASAGRRGIRHRRIRDERMEDRRGSRPSKRAPQSCLPTQQTLRGDRADAGQVQPLDEARRMELRRQPVPQPRTVQTVGYGCDGRYGRPASGKDSQDPFVGSTVGADAGTGRSRVQLLANHRSGVGRSKQTHRRTHGRVSCRLNTARDE